MRDSNDEIAVNETLALNVSFEMEAMAENRRHALAQGALFSTSALVNTYSQKTAMVIDRAVVLFAAVDNRVGWLVQHKP